MPRPTPTRPALPAALLSLVLALALPPAPSVAQDGAIRLGRSLQLSGTELEVTADSFEVDQGSGASVFAGQVLAVQGDLRLTAGVLRLEFSTDGNGRRRIERLIATGGVTMVTPDEAIEAREAVYNLPRGTLDMTGDVLFLQGQNVMSGQQFSVDLNSGTGRMSGRVRTVIRMD